MADTLYKITVKDETSSKEAWIRIDSIMQLEEDVPGVSTSIFIENDGIFSETPIKVQHPISYVLATLGISVIDLSDAPSPPPPPPPPPPTQETPNLFHTESLNTPITNARGTKFDIRNTDGSLGSGKATTKVYKNGLPMLETAFLAELAYVNHTLWQKNSGGDWYSLGDDDVTWSMGTTVNPLGAQ